jgi:hypothetical protein
VRQTPAAYAEALRYGTGSERHRDLTWSAGAYVCHVGDNLRIWAERLAGVAAGAGTVVATYDQDLFGGEALRGDRIGWRPVVAGPGRYRLDGAVDQATAADVVLHHPERGDLTVADVVRSNAHDAFHHGWDIKRSLAPPVARR